MPARFFFAAPLGMTLTSLVCLVVAIHDGASLGVRCESAAAPQTVHLAGIAAPPLSQSEGQRAREGLVRLVQDRTVALRCAPLNHHAPHACTVWSAPDSAPQGPRTLDVGHALLSQGLVWVLPGCTPGLSAQAREAYSFAETEARAKKSGLWARATTHPSAKQPMHGDTQPPTPGSLQDGPHDLECY